jgi:hypothetical protein
MRARVVGVADGTPDSVTRIPAGLKENIPAPTGDGAPGCGVNRTQPTCASFEEPSLWRTNVPPGGMEYEKVEAAMPPVSRSVRGLPASSNISIIPASVSVEVFRRTRPVV